MIVLLESEIWPNWLRVAKEFGAKVVIVNGRISANSAARYAKVRSLTKFYLNKIDLVCAREKADAERFERIGVPEEKVEVTGNLKFDLLPWNLNGNHGAQNYESIFHMNKYIIWTAASVRDKALNDGIQRLREVEGVGGAILVDQYGLVVAANLDASIDEGLAGALITNVYRTASGNAPKMGVGEFEEGLIEGEAGNVHIVQFGDMIMAVFAASTVKMGLLEKTIREFSQAVLEKY